MMQPAALQHLPMETQAKLRRASWVQFAASMLQLACSVAIIVMIRYNLEGATVSIFNIGGQPVGNSRSYQCLMSAESEGACQYAYSVASISILVGFVMSLMQCLTMDCCGMGRLMETLVDAGLASWWLAAGVTLGSRAARANAVGIAKAGHRNAVVALCWVSLALFIVLFLVNGYLTLKLGWRMRRLAAPGTQPGGMGGIQMGGIPTAGPYAAGGYPAAAGGYPGQPGPYGGAAWGAPQGVPAYGYPAGPGGMPPPGMWGAPPPPYAAGPPFTQAVVGAPYPTVGAVGSAAPAGAAPGGGGAAAAAAGPSSGFAAAAPGGAQQQQQPQSPEKGPLAGNPANYLPGAGR